MTVQNLFSEARELRTADANYGIQCSFTLPTYAGIVKWVFDDEPNQSRARPVT